MEAEAGLENETIQTYYKIIVPVFHLLVCRHISRLPTEAHAHHQVLANHLALVNMRYRNQPRLEAMSAYSFDMPPLLYLLLLLTACSGCLSLLF